MLHQVGVGTLGPVFRTYEPTRDRLVAVKVFRLDITPEQAQSLADELSKPADAGLFHPSIIEPVGAGVEGTSAYRADEYVAAETLDVAMRHYAPAPVEKVLPFITQLAGAIDFARSAGIGHGALHPRDIFVTPEEARAGGFGVVEALERVGLRAPIRRPYTAPERIVGGTWGTPADVFSLAVIAYEMITGRRPSGTGEQIAPITGGAQSAAVHAVIVRAMSEDPVRRYPTALAFASALDAAARGEGAATPAPAVAAAAVDVSPAEAEFPEESHVETEAPAHDTIAAARRQDVVDAPPHEPDVFNAPSAREVEPPRTVPAPVPGRTLFEPERVDDLTIDEDDRDLERFAGEFAEAAASEDDLRPAAATVPPPPRTIAPLVTRDERHDEAPAVPFEPPAPLSGYGDEPMVVREQHGIGIVPVVITVFLALLVGFAAGYSVARRAPAPTEDQPVAAASPQTQPAAPQQPQAQPKPYSEQAVTPAPAEPPSPVSEPSSRSTPPATRPPAAAIPETPRAAPTTGSVEVRSSPSGAGVTVDGKWRGRTPITVKDLTFGSHVVRIIQPGYETEREDVRLSTGTPTRQLSYKLQRAAPPPRPVSRPQTSAPAARTQAYAGSIYVDSRPRNARVLVDGKFMGTTPVRIPDVAIGSHVVRLQLQDHRDWTTSTRVTAGEEARVTGSLERIR